jgi:flagellar biosynthesis/type III secretory pathway chaperone
MGDKIQSELKEVQKKLEEIEKKQEMLNKIQQMDRDRREKRGERPISHSYEMM